MRLLVRALAMLLATAACGAIALDAGIAAAFPGIAVSVAGTPPKISTTEIVVMEHAGVSIVTLAVDYQGPLERLALVTLVPRDVEPSRLETVKHEFIARLEQMTAPRLFEFWEQDPCIPGPPQQAWEEKVAVKNRGFLTPEVMPPRDAHYPVSNELSIPAAPVFKEAEAEFSYQLLRPKSSAELWRWLQKRGFRVELAALEPLSGALDDDTQVLVAQVAVDRAELIDGERLQLGGIRYWSRRPLLPVLETLGRSQQAERHDLFVYTMHREKRYRAANLENVFAPTNLRVTLDVGAKVGRLYNTLFERLLASRPVAAVTEFVGPSDECGEPCSNAPLELRELLTFGGDVLEATLPKEAPSAPAQSQVRPSAGVASAPSKEQHQIEQQLAAKRSLLARQRYVVTRLHLRSNAATTQHDLELVSNAARESGGIGIPRGPNAELPAGVRPTKQSRYQVRFHAVHPWQGALPCAKPERWRWGKRWQSETQHWRGVHVARDLLRAGEDPKLVDAVLLSAVPEIGFEPRTPNAPPLPKSAPEREAPPASTCQLARGRTSDDVPSVSLLLAAWLAGWRRRSVRVGTRAQSGG